MRTYEGTQTDKEGCFRMNKFNASQRIGQLELNLIDKPATLSFDGDDVSGNAGVLLASQVEKMTGLLAGAQARLADHRTSSLIKHCQFELIAQRVFQIMSGAAACDDSDYLRHDPAIKIGTGREPLRGEALASQPTQSRFENNRTYRELLALGEWLVEYYIQCHPKPPKSLILDFDGSAIETYGLQLNAFYRGGPYKKYMYFPLFVFDSEGWLLVAALRPGDQGECHFSLPVLKRLVAKLRRAWPEVKITIRADGAFTDPALYKWLDENSVDYVLGLKHNNVLLTYSKNLRQKARKKFVRKFCAPAFIGKVGEKKKLEAMHEVHSQLKHEDRSKLNSELTTRVRLFGEFSYQAGSWDRPRRVICRCDFGNEGLDVRYIVTSISWMSAADTYEKLYCGRARIEMWIKHIKETRANRLSCSQFKANAFRLLLHAFAYLLMHQIRLLIDCQTSMSLEFVRRRFINVPVHVCETSQGCHFRISSAYKDARLFRKISKKLGARSLIAA